VLKAITDLSESLLNLGFIGRDLKTNGASTRRWKLSGMADVQGIALGLDSRISRDAATGPE